MEKPQLFGIFHIMAALTVTGLALLGAVRAKRLNPAGRIRLLCVCGWVLAALEVYKQLFLYYIVNDGTYDWWYFPFQLCSVPMYLCMLLPVIFTNHRTVQSSSLSCTDSNVANASTPPAQVSRGSACSPSKSAYMYSATSAFLATYTLVGAAAALIIPEDFLRSYVSLTLHGFIWHGLLLFISLTAAQPASASPESSDQPVHGFTRATVLFLGLCMIAVLINIAAEPVMADKYAAGLVHNQYAAMFYLNPYHLSPQPIVGSVQKLAGIPAGLVLYLITIIIAAAAVHAVSKLIILCKTK